MDKLGMYQKLEELIFDNLVVPIRLLDVLGLRSKKSQKDPNSGAKNIYANPQ